ncbi:MAG TPA: N-acetyltransferase [Alphaproteobacteria bacterium]|nr:N-acetyltransferase [Alphaproteobacteria bacterium]
MHSVRIMNHNTRARRFYEKLGFGVAAAARRAAPIDGRRGDFVYMAKFLEEEAG